MNVLVLGTVAFDSIETPFGAVEGKLGGSATYIALAARYFTSEIGLVAVVGGDFPDEYLNLLSGRGIDLSGVEVKTDERTFAWAGRYHYDLNDRETLATHLNVLTNFDPVVPEAWKDSRIVCLGNVDPKLQMQALDQVRNPEIVISDTMNFWIENTPEDLKHLLARIDCLVINDAEARQLSGEPNLMRAASIVRAMGPDTLIIKKGEHGALLFTNGVTFSAPAYPLEDIHDPTGAGDTFMGGIAGFLSCEQDYTVDTLKRALIYGSAMASFCVEAFGPDRLLSLTDKDIGERVDGFVELCSVPALSPIFTK